MGYCCEEDKISHRFDGEKFSVTQFFPNGSYEVYVKYVDGDTAVAKFRHLINSVGAKLGTTVRVILTDGGDCINLEWEHGKGVTFPPELVGKL